MVGVSDQNLPKFDWGVISETATVKMIEPKLPENPLAISWHDTQWLSFLNQHTVMEYFSERSNPFYDRTCNNEILKMQRGSPEQLVHMQGIEFCLLHVQEPILFVIRKQHRTSPTQVMDIWMLLMLETQRIDYITRILLTSVPDYSYRGLLHHQRHRVSGARPGIGVELSAAYDC